MSPTINTPTHLRQGLEAGGAAQMQPHEAGGEVVAVDLVGRVGDVELRTARTARHSAAQRVWDVR